MGFLLYNFNPIGREQVSYFLDAKIVMFLKGTVVLKFHLWDLCHEFRMMSLFQNVDFKF